MEIPPPLVSVTVWSGLLFVRVIVSPVSEMERPVPAVIVTFVEPDVLDCITDVVPVPARTVRLPSFVAERSPVLVIVVPVMEMPVPAE